MTTATEVEAGAEGVSFVELAAVRRAIGRGWLRGRGERPAAERVRLGAVVLEAHQVEAVARLRRVLEENGGALLADGVGTGKTYVALALGAEAERVVVVGPAVLRGMWREAMARCGVTGRWVSFEGLSRGVEVRGGGSDLVIVDEAHHARTPGTRRFGRLAELCVGARVLMLSATPVHNSSADVRALVSLWRGAAAYGMDDEALARVVVRRSAERVRASLVERGARMPEVGAPSWEAVSDDGGVADALLALPPPLPVRDGGGADWLVTFGLVRQWASSDAALRAAVRRRLGQCVALEAALESGRHPGRRELRGWVYAEGTVQLAFPELAVGMEVGGGVEALRGAVRAHAAGLRRVRAALESRPSVDAERAERLMEIVARHPAERVVAFAGFGATVDELYRRLRGRVRAAALDGRGGRVAGGVLTREELLRRFAPRASGGGRVAAAERVELLLTTDLLSEGVNLQDASVVVHLDLPWTPARLAQRVGRVARLGSESRRVSVYALAPPASAERWVEVERRLREKAGAAAQAIGAIGGFLPGMAVAGGASAVEGREAVRAVLERWAGEGDVRAEGGDLRVALAVGGGEPGFLALVRRAGRTELVASAGGAGQAVATTSIARVLAAVRAADRAGEWKEGADGGACRKAVAALRAAVARWDEGERVAIDVGLRGGATALVRRRALERIARSVRRAPRHRRAAVGALAGAARAAAVAGYGAGAERMLAELVAAELQDEAWLGAVGAFGALHGRAPAEEEGEGQRSRPAGRARLLAAIILLA